MLDVRWHRSAAGFGSAFTAQREHSRAIRAVQRLDRIDELEHGHALRRLPGVIANGPALLAKVHRVEPMSNDALFDMKPPTS
jgi:hypothetical protein